MKMTDSLRAYDPDKGMRYFTMLDLAQGRVGDLGLTTDSDIMRALPWKDMKGNPIYEDDIAVRRWDNGTIRNLYRVKFNTKNGSYNMNQSLLNAVGRTPKGNISKGFEVIGNRYENPELLNLDQAAAYFANQSKDKPSFPAGFGQPG